MAKRLTGRTSPRATPEPGETLPYRPAGERSAPPFRAWDRRGVVLAVAAALLVAAVAVYGGSSRGIVLLRLLLVDGPLLALWLLAAASLGGVLLRPFEGGRHRRAAPPLRFVTSAALGLGAFSLLLLGLGLLGRLDRATGFALLGASLLPSLFALARRHKEFASADAGAAVKSWLGAPAGWAWLWLVVVPLAGLVVVGAMLPSGVLWTPHEPHGYDVAEYHVQIPREWFEAGRIVPLRHNVFSYFPFNVEMHYLLAMHLSGGPWEGMYLAQLMHATMLGLTALAVYALSREAFGVGGATVAGVVTAGAPWAVLLAPIAYNEGGLLLFGTLAAGWALRASRDEHHTLRAFALAGLMAGFASGSKLTGVPAVLIGVAGACAVAALLPRQEGAHERGADARDEATGEPTAPRRGTLLTGVGVYLACGLLAFSPWLIRNQVWAGNPVFPEAMPLLGRGHFSQVQVERWAKAHAPRDEQRPVAARLAALKKEVLTNWGFGYVLLPLAVAAAVMAVGRRDAQILMILLAGFAVFWLGFTHLQSRFFAMAVPWCALLIGGLPRPWRVTGVVAALGVAGVALANVHPRLYDRLHGAGVGVVDAVGRTRIDWLMSASVDRVPPDAPVTLVGEARAFFYPIPMSRLRYRTVFDVDTTGTDDIVRAWTAPDPTQAATQVGLPWLVVDPNELRRFHETYRNIPLLPPELRDRPNPFLMTPEGKVVE